MKKKRTSISIMNPITIATAALYPSIRKIFPTSAFADGVYDPKLKNKERVYELIKDKRIKHFAPADYSQDSTLEVLIKKILLNSST